MKTILIVEDEPLVMSVLRFALNGFRLLEAVTAEQARRLYRENSLDIDLLLADVVLPDGSGVEVALQMRRENPDLPVIFTFGCPPSLWGHRDTELAGRLTHPVVLLQKPFLPDRLRELVEEMVRPRADLLLAARSGAR